MRHYQNIPDLTGAELADFPTRGAESVGVMTALPASLSHSV